jgi:hypothetical protein
LRATISTSCTTLSRLIILHYQHLLLLSEESQLSSLVSMSGRKKGDRQGEEVNVTDPIAVQTTLRV